MKAPQNGWLNGSRRANSRPSAAVRFALPLSFAKSFCAFCGAHGRQLAVDYRRLLALEHRQQREPQKVDDLTDVEAGFDGVPDEANSRCSPAVPSCDSWGRTRRGATS